MIYITRYKKVKESKRIIKTIVNNPENFFIIHYSCESFMDKEDGSTPRITSIAIRYLKSAQTRDFSIHTIAEQRHIPIEKIEENYDKCEKEMLKAYFEFIKKNQNMKWIHWNMRDTNYGFYAIENRYIVLGGKPEYTHDDKKIDLARLLVDRYGKYYIENPKIQKLIEKNHMTKLDFLTGAEEASAFINKEYIKLHKSTLRKVDLFSSILMATAENTLKTNSKIKDIYGITPQGIYEACKENWLFYLITNILFLIIGTILGKILR